MFAPIIIMILSCIAPCSLYASSNQRPTPINTADWGKTGKSLYLHLLRTPHNQAAWDAYKEEKYAKDEHARIMHRASVSAQQAISILAPQVKSMYRSIYRCMTHTNESRSFYVFHPITNNDGINMCFRSENLKQIPISPSTELPDGAVIFCNKENEDSSVQNAFLAHRANIYHTRKHKGQR